MSEAAKPSAIPAKHVAAVVVGNALAFYDFLSYAFFAVQIGRAFFPDPQSSLLLSFATFGVGFLARPIGGIVIGTLADRIGRKPAMMLSFALMGVGIVGVALTPSYAQIGVAAPLLVLFFRLVLGFALGGEVGPTTAYLLEAAPPARRGFYTSLQFATQDFSVFLAGLVGFTLASVMSEASLDAWGWRVAFLIGAAVVPVGLYIRRSLPETLHAPEGEASATAAQLRPYLGVAALGILLLAAGTMVAYSLTSLTAYASSTLHMTAQAAFLATLGGGLANTAMDPVGGWLSDKFGRKPLIIIGTLLVLVISIPAFLLIVQTRSPAVLFLVSALLGAANGVGQPAVLTTITEALPRPIRAGTLSIVYAIAISIFGGTTPFMITWLVQTTGNPLAPAGYIVLASLLGLATVLAMRETAPARIAASGAKAM